MPIPLKFYGARPAITGDRQVPSLPTSKAAEPPIQVGRWFRNTKAPDATAFSMLNGALNSAVLFRSKTLFEATSYMGTGGGHILGSAAGTRAVWRGAFRTSPYSHAILCRAFMYPPTSGYLFDTYSKIDIYSDVSESTLVKTVEFHYGPSPTASSSATGWQYLKHIDKLVDGLSADTDYYIKVSDVDYGLMQSLSIADIQSLTTGYSGYLPQNFSSESQLLDEYRQNLVTPMPTLWKRAGAKVLNWSAIVQSSPRTIAVNTPTNIIDGTTAVATSSAGFTLDMRFKNRLSQSTGVPVIMKVCCSTNSGTGAGRVYLKDSAGATVMSITDGWTVGGALKWQSVTGVLPATRAKYDLMTDNNGSGTLSTYAWSIWEHE